MAILKSEGEEGEGGGGLVIMTLTELNLLRETKAVEKN